MYSKPATWNQARKFCKSKNSNLAMPKDIFETNDISTISFNKTKENIEKIHLGFHNLFSKEEYVTENGITINYYSDRYVDINLNDSKLL